MKKFLLLSLLLLGVVINKSWAQTPGLIIKPAQSPGNSVLDPDGDGYVSQKTNGVQLGFTIPPNNDVTQSEIPYVAIVKPDPTADLERGPVGAFIEIVGVDAAGNNAILTYNDGTNFLVRFRLGGYAPNSKSYALLIDTDQKFGFTGENADPNAVSGNPGFEAEIVLETNFNVKAFNVNGTTSGSLVASSSFETNCQQSVAISAASDDPDYFYDFYLPFSAISTLFTPTTPLRIVAVTVMNPNGAMGSNSLSDIGGVTSGNNIDGIYETLVDNQTPTVPGEETLDRSACPTINAVSTSSTAISGTSTEASGTQIKVSVYQSNGTTLVGSGTTSTSGSAWTINVSSLSPSVTLTADYLVKATATATGKGESFDNCDIETVSGVCASPPAAPVVTDANSKGICGTIASGATLNIYKNGVLLYSTSTTIVGTLQISGTSFSYKPNGSFSNCNSGTSAMPDGYYEVSQTVGGCESSKVAYSNSCTGTSTTPVITSPIYAGTVTISGTSGASASVELLINGVSSGTTTATVGGAWSFASKTVTAGQVIKVNATETSTCTAGVSSEVTVLNLPTPVITSGGCGTVTTVYGYINATSGIVQIYLSPSNVAQGSSVSIQSNGDWNVTGLSISSGSYYAKATLTGGTTSNSATATVSSQTTNATAITTAVIYEGATTISGTGTNGDEIRLYVDQADISKTTTVSGGTWTISGIPTYEFYIGATVHVTAKSSGQCESTASASKTVQCVEPTAPAYTAGDYPYCYGSAGSISLSTSQTGVIYVLVNSSGVEVGPASVGNGGGIALYTNALTSDLLNIYVKAYKIGYSSCSTTGTTVVNFTPQSPSPTVTLSSTALSVLKGTTSVNLPYSAKSSSPSADTYTIDYSILAQNQGFVDITTETAITSSSGNIALAVPSGAAAGTYSATMSVKANSGSSCTTYYSFTITVYTSSDPPVIYPHPSGTTICSGNNTTLTVGATGSGLSYQWQSGSSYTGTFTNVSDGSGGTSASYTTANLSADKYYRVVVSNSSGATTSNVAKVTVSALPSAAGTITGNSTVCRGETSVAYSISALSNTTSYTWSYSGSGATISGTTNSISINFGQTATSGTLTVYGTNACGNGTSATKSITVNETPFINTITKNTCSGVAFSVTPVNVTNGTVPSGTTYSWSAPSVTGSMTGGASGSGSSSIGGTLTNTTSSSQTATYTITPVAGSCTGSTFTVTVTVYPQISLTATPVAVLCNGASTGSVNLSISGGTPAYTYAWTGPSYSATTQNLSGLAAGTYNLTVTDSKSCTATTSAAVTEPTVMSITPTITNVNCYGALTGAVSVSVSGGTGTKTYLWSDGATTQNRTNIAAGDYTVTVTDANGCTKTSSTISVTQPSAAISASSSNTNVSCYGGSDGAITQTISGGTSPYTYLWNDSNTGKDRTSLTAGTYQVVITDNKSCTKTVNYTITQPAVLSLSTTVTNETCPSTGDGAIDLTVNGGTSPYTYDWSNDGYEDPDNDTQDLSSITSGSYTVYVTDSKNCQANTTVTVSANNPNPVTPGTITK